MLSCFYFHVSLDLDMFIVKVRSSCRTNIFNNLENTVQLSCLIESFLWFFISMLQLVS